MELYEKTKEQIKKDFDSIKTSEKKAEYRNEIVKYLHELL
jgi:hypothetical protein